jgi:hypothetical protein
MITVKITCDLCGSQATGEKCREHDEERLREAAEVLGWKSVLHDGKQKDMCPACVKAWHSVPFAYYLKRE